MFILDDLYVSDEVLDFLEESQELVLDNATAQRLALSRTLNICSEEKARTILAQPGSRLCALSEMNLDVAKRICNAETAQAIELFKNKAAMRRALKPLYPNYVFEEYTFQQLSALDASKVAYPVVVKPSTGFFSLGIFPVFNEEQWHCAMEDIKAHSASWSDVYNTTVVNNSDFLVESYIEGEEYAVDAYLDEEGQVVVLNVLRHDFAGTDDVSDRLYFTSADVIKSQIVSMTAFLTKANEVFGLRDFPFHVEVRKQPDGSIVPIEFNPLRFAGLCTTDVSYFAYGFKTYEYFLQNKRPNWETLLEGKDSLTYPMMLLTKPGFDATKPYVFDYAALRGRFRNILKLRETDFALLSTFGFVFPETRVQDWDSEIAPLLSSNLEEFLTYENHEPA